jgi:hypothetical protein
LLLAGVVSLLLTGLLAGLLAHVSLLTGLLAVVGLLLAGLLTGLLAVVGLLLSRLLASVGLGLLLGRLQSLQGLLELLGGLLLILAGLTRLTLLELLGGLLELLLGLLQLVLHGHWGVGLGLLQGGLGGVVRLLGLLERPCRIEQLLLPLLLPITPLQNRLRASARRQVRNGQCGCVRPRISSQRLGTSGVRGSSLSALLWRQMLSGSQPGTSSGGSGWICSYSTAPAGDAAGLGGRRIRSRSCSPMGGSG